MSSRRRARDPHASDYVPKVGATDWRALIVGVIQREKEEARLLRELAKFADSPATFELIAKILANKPETIVDLNSLLDYRER